MLAEAEEAGADEVGGPELAEKIKGGWTDFDACIATPDMMGIVGPLGKILGPRGLMPSPRAGTVTPDVAKTIHEYIRDPDANPLPDGIPPRRMAIYTELFFNNINDQLSGNFPVLRQITNDHHWRALVRDFMRRHRSTTPLFTAVGQEFLDYLQHEREPAADDWPFMLELAHYEYVELAVAIGDDDDDSGFDPNGDWRLRY